MKRSSIILVAAIWLLVIASFPLTRLYFNRKYVEQEIRYAPCSCERKLYTYAWSNREIVKMWADPADSVSEQLLKKRRAEANKLLEAISK